MFTIVPFYENTVVPIILCISFTILLVENQLQLQEGWRCSNDIGDLFSGDCVGI